MSESNIGPQKGPSSISKIQAEQKSVIKSLKELRELCCEKFDDHQKRYNITTSVRNMGYHDGAMGAFNMVAKSLESILSETSQPKPYHCTKCGGAGWSQRSTGEVIECDDCDSCGL